MPSDVSLIQHDWKSGNVPPQIMQFGAPIVSGLWDQTHSFVSHRPEIKPEVSLYFGLIWFQTKCCGIDGPSDWLFTNANQTRFFGEIPQTCCLPEDRKNVTIDGQLMQFCDANDLESIFPGCGEQFTTYSVRKKICHLRGSNTGPSDLQSDALPAELKRRYLG